MFCQAGHSKLAQVPGKDQIIVTGNGGPSGTGKRPTSECVLPPPVFIQDSLPVPAGLKNVPHNRSVISAVVESSVPSLTSSNSVAVDSSLKSSTVLSNQKKKKIDMFDSKTLLNTETVEGNLGRQNNKKEPEIVKTVQELLAASPVDANVVKMVGFFKNPVEVVEVLSVNSEFETRNSETTNLFAMKDIVLNCELSNDVFLLKTDEKFNSNGVSTCAVFPVPVSSFVVSVWGNILKGSSSNLMINPYKLLRVPFSELLDLTLPPVDASCLTPWPKPLIYYSEESIPEISNDENISVSTKTTDSEIKTCLEKGAGVGVAMIAKESIVNQDKNLSSILALRQIFPTVNMNVGLPCSDFRSDS
jgi:hypothetical protein